ncbi:MAG: IucA/IucC family protein [Pseudomonadota bacterium]
MNALPQCIAAAPANPVSNMEIDISFAEAGKRGLQRTLQALFRERLLNLDHLIVEGAISWLPLWSRQSILRFEGLHIGRIGNCELAGQVSCYEPGERPRALATSSALVALVAGAWPHATAINIDRLIQELDNSTENDALCLRYRREWAEELNIAIRASGHANLVAMLMTACPEDQPNPTLLLEQWGTLGHPWHPGYKTKLGLTVQEVKELSPEFRASLTVSLMALKADKAHVAMIDGIQDYRTWFAETFPQHLLRWDEALRQRRHDPSAWLPVPVHPYQASRLLPERFAAEIVNGDLLLLPEVQMGATPTMSFRTVVPDGASDVPHIKLPVSLRLTSVQRTVSPKSAVMGPRLTQLLRRIVAHEGGFGGTLDIVGEEVGVHYIDPNGDDDRSRHLSVLFRCNPMSKRRNSLFPIPAGALFADTPVDGRALVTELVTLAYGDHTNGALQFYKHYVDTVLTAVLGPYLLYGIAFEAHQQNSFMMVDRDYRPVQLLVRDFGDLRVHGPSLQRTGLKLEVFREGHTVFDTEVPVRDKFLHAVMLCHLSELGLLLSRSYRHTEVAFFNVLRASTVDAFDRLRDRADPHRWKAERAAVLEANWPAKALLRMRLSDTSDDVHGEMANPLASAGQ